MHFFLAFFFFLMIQSSHAGLIYDSDLSPSLITQMKSDLSFISKVNLSSQTPMHQNVFGKNSTPYANWFNARVKTVGKSLCGSDNAVACVLSAWENKIWITPNYVTFDHPQIARLSVLFHEARHTEKDQGFWPHVTCPTPFLDDLGQSVKSIWTGALLQGEKACDVMAFGSYGVQTLFLRNISLFCKNCTEKVKQDADLFAQDQLNRVIDPKTKTQMKKDLLLSKKQKP